MNVRLEGLRGERGLLVAVIQQAEKDATEGRGEWRADGRRYFASSDYEHHITALGLPSDALPARFLEAIDEQG